MHAETEVKIEPPGGGSQMAHTAPGPRTRCYTRWLNPVTRVQAYLENLVSAMDEIVPLDSSQATLDNRPAASSWPRGTSTLPPLRPGTENFRPPIHVLLPHEAGVTLAPRLHQSRQVVPLPNGLLLHRCLVTQAKNSVGWDTTTQFRHALRLSLLAHLEREKRSLLRAHEHEVGPAPEQHQDGALGASGSREAWLSPCSPL